MKILKSKFKMGCALSIAIAILLSISCPAFAAPTFYELQGLPYIYQDYDYWCWAACGASIVGYYGTSIEQLDFVYAVKGCYYVGVASIFEMPDGLSHWGIHSHAFEGILGYDGIISNLYNMARPVMAAWTYTFGCGHAVLISAYSYDSSGNQYVYFRDPANTGTFYMSYNLFVNNADFSWTYTLDQIYLT